MSSYKNIIENWCPSSAGFSDCNKSRWLGGGTWPGCSQADCEQPGTCQLKTVQSSTSPNSSSEEALIDMLKSGRPATCIATTGCSSDDLESALAPSPIPFDGRPIGLHLSQWPNQHNDCSNKGAGYRTDIEVSRGTYGGPGTSADLNIQVGHIPLSLSDQCYLLHDLMYNLTPPMNSGGILHADRVLLHNLNYVRQNYGESLPRNQESAVSGFCTSVQNQQGGWSFLSTGLATIISNQFAGTIWDDSNGMTLKPGAMPVLKRMFRVIQAMKIASANASTKVIDMFGVFDEFTPGASMSAWWGRVNPLNYDGSNQQYYAYDILNYDYFASNNVLQVFPTVNVNWKSWKNKSYVDNCD